MHYCGMSSIHFSTVPLNYDGVLENNRFIVPESPGTAEVLNTHARLWKGARYGSVDPELELYNFVANRWPFIKVISRTANRRQLPLTFSLSRS